MFGPPLMQLFVLSSAATLEVSNVDIAVFNDDRGRASHEVIERIDAAQLRSRSDPGRPSRTITQLIDQREVLAGVHISRGFFPRRRGRRPAAFQVLIDGRRANAGQITLSYLQTIASRLWRRLTGEHRPPRCRSRGAALVQPEPAVHLVLRAGDDRASS